MDDVNFGEPKIFQVWVPKFGVLESWWVETLACIHFLPVPTVCCKTFSHRLCAGYSKKGENAPHISIINTSVVPRTGNSIKPPKCRLTQTEMLEFLISLARHHQLEFHLHFPVDGYGCAWLPPAWATDEQLLNLRRLLPLPLPPYMTRTFLGAKLYTYSKKMQA